MASLPCELKFEFQAARERVMELTRLYRSLKHLPDTEPAQQALRNEIEQCEVEIAAAKKEMTARHGSHFSIRDQNVLIPIIPSWIGHGKDGITISENHQYINGGTFSL